MIEALLWFLLVLVLLQLAFGLLSFVLQVAALSLPVWGVACVLACLPLAGVAIFRVRDLRSQKRLSLLICPLLENDRLSWSVNERELQRYAKSATTEALALMSTIGLGFALLRLSSLHRNGAFSNVTFALLGETVRPSPTMTAILGLIFSGAVLLCLVSMVGSQEILQKIIGEHLNKLVSRLSMALRAEMLSRLETSIRSLARELEIDFPANFRPAVQRYATAHTTELLRDVSSLEELVASNMRQAEEDMGHLQTVRDLYLATKNFYTEVSREVNKTGLMPLIKELDYDYRGLTSQNLMFLITERNWSDFQDIVRSIIEDLRRLRDLAAKCQEEGCESEIDAYANETEEERAYRVLGIPPTATNDQIKRSYRTLASIWHPDAGAVTDDSRFKEINWGYELLKKSRNFT